MRFICGDSFQEKAGIVLDSVYKGVNGELYLPESLRGQYGHDDVIFYKKRENDIIFCRTDFLPQLDAEIDLSDYILITHNSDININEKIQLNNEPKLWLAQNGNHKSVVTVPLGLENERFGKWRMITELRKENVKRTNLVYLNVSPASNPVQRYKCIEKAESFGIRNDFKLSGDNYMVDQLRYMKELQKSYFVLCPEGAGIDTHRAFEALYMGAIPVVTRSFVTERLEKSFNLSIFDSWDDFDPSLLTEELYHEMKSDQDKEDNLDFDVYFNRLIK